MQDRQGFKRHLIPLLLAQTLTVFNDHCFKTLAALAAIAGSQSSGQDAAFLTMILVAYVMPFILIGEPAGFLADRFSKKQVLLAAKVAELVFLILGCLALANAGSWGPYPLLVVMSLLALQATIFSPSFNGLLPETFREHDLSRVNGYVGMATFVAIIGGAGGAFLLKSQLGPELYLSGLLLALLSVLGLICIFFAQMHPPANPERRCDWNFPAKYWKGMLFFRGRRPLLLAVLGEAYFVAFGTAVQLVLMLYGKYTLKIAEGDSLSLGMLQLAPALGMGLGCWLAGSASRGKVELGLVPYGAFGVVFFVVLAALFPGEAILLSGPGLTLYPQFMFFMLLVGIAGGLFVLPLRAYQQQKTEPETRGTVLANANVISFTAVLAAGLSFHFLGSGQMMSFSPEMMLLTLAGLTLFVSAYAFWLLPEFALRFVVVALTHSVYRIRISGEENIPEKGPALLVANHVSFVDGLLISACSSRIIHFLMHQDYYRAPLINPIARVVGFVEVPNGGPRKMGTMFEQTKDFLRRGEVVCIFPEGKLTRNGLMDEFKGGINRMIPEEINVPIIPIRLGMIWGSIFSYYYGKLKFRFPKELPHPASVTIGKPAPPNCTPFELRQLVSELGAETEMQARPEERPIHYQLAKLAKRHPFRKFLIDVNGGQLSAFETLLRSILLSRELKKIVPADDKYVGILLPNTSAGTVTLLAALLADKVPAPLNYTAARESIDAAVRKAGITKIFTSRIFLKKIKMEESPEMVFLEDVAAGIGKASRIKWAILAALLPHQELLKILAPKSHRNVFATAVLLFSSGSTGTPKGVMLSHHNINSDVYSFLRIMGWQSTDRIAGNMPLFHSFGFTTCFWVPIISGCQVVYIPNPLDGKAIGEAIAKHKLTLLLVTPSFLQSYMRKWDASNLSSLRLVISGAEKLRHDIADKFRESTGLAVVEGYGCTELSPVVSINIGNSILNISTVPGYDGSIGAPMPGICVKIVNPDTFAELPPDAEGLMLVKGPNVMQGYLNDPAKTAEVLKDGWYNTGDIARMNTDGYITITGRLSRFSKIAGEMVPHEMIEATLGELAGTEERCVAVSSVPDSEKGERLVVIVTPAFPFSPEEAVSKLRERNLPNLWIPRANSFFKVETIPMLGSGKLDLGKVKELAMELGKT